MKIRREIIEESVMAQEACYNYYVDNPIEEALLSRLRTVLEMEIPVEITTSEWNSLAVGNMLEDEDWERVFEYAAAGDIFPAPPHDHRISLMGFTRDDVKVIQHIREGENEILTWICIGQLKDGRWFNLEAGCDYTGWDCQASGRTVVAADYDTLVRLGCNQETRRLFGVIV